MIFYTIFVLVKQTQKKLKLLLPKTKENNIETDAVDLEKIDLILEPRIREFIFDLGEYETQHSGFYFGGSDEILSKIEGQKIQIDERSIKFDKLINNSNTNLSFRELNIELDFKNELDNVIELKCDLNKLKDEAYRMGLSEVTGSFQYKPKTIGNVNMTVPGKNQFYNSNKGISESNY